MSATPHTPVPQGLDGPLPMTLPRLAEKKQLGEKYALLVGVKGDHRPGRLVTASHSSASGRAGPRVSSPNADSI